MLVWVSLHYMLSGVVFSMFGMLYVEYSDYFQETKATIGWIVSIQTATKCIVGKRVVVTLHCNPRGGGYKGLTYEQP